MRFQTWLFLGFGLASAACNPCCNSGPNRPAYCSGTPDPATPSAASGSVSECGFDTVMATSGPARDLLVSPCIDATVRQTTGAATHGARVVLVDVVVAQAAPAGSPPGTPVVPVRTAAQVAADFGVINNAFTPGQISFVVNSVTNPPGAPANATTATLSNNAIFPAAAPNLVVLYASQLTNAAGNPLRGVAIPGRGAIYSTTAMINSTLPHELGHALGLRHTFDCVVAAAFPNDQSRNGDEIADTPLDPAINVETCSTAPAPGNSAGSTAGGCTLAGCTVTCTGGQTPDATNLMSYYGACRTQFTAGQIESMRCECRRDLANRCQCTAGLTECSVTDASGPIESCVDTLTDSQNCGACGTACKATERCTGGRCTAACTGPLTLCGRSCVDLRNDNQNCGSCGEECQAGTTCRNRRCVDNDGGCAGTCTAVKPCCWKTKSCLRPSECDRAPDP